MRDPLVDIRDSAALSSALTQVFLFVEQLNAHASLKARTLSGSARSSGQLFARNSIIQEVGSGLLREGGSWRYRTKFLELLGRAGIKPAVDRELIEASMSFLKGLNLTEIPKPEKLEVNRAWTYEGISGFSSFSSVRFEGSRSSGRPVSLYFWEEPWNSLGIVHLFLSHLLGEESRAVDHYLQQWLRSEFDLTYDTETKYCLASICAHFNSLYYGSPVPSSQDIHVHRPATLGTSLLITEFVRLLKSRPGAARPDWTEEFLLRQALGIYLFIRFCRQLRCRFFWSASPESEPFEVDDHQCCTALRSLSYSYFEARMFGRISSIPGLSNIFRGGLLPRTTSGTTMTLIGPPGSGKTVLALQMMVDVARFGGIAVYFSFEESYNSIVDRLVTFGLYDPDMFKVEAAGQNIDKVIGDAAAADPHKGILIFYDSKGGESFDLLKSIDGVGSATKEIRRPKTLGIDSVSALKVLPTRGSDDAFLRRINLRSLVDKIEEIGYLGVILNERDDPSSTTLSYLTDTVMHVGIDENLHARWVEIIKCRLQDYQSGRHSFRMMDGRGVTIYPSLVARRSSLRRRVRSTLSEQRRLLVPEPWSRDLDEQFVREKSSTLLWGPSGGGKTLLLLNLLTEPCQIKRDGRHGRLGANQKEMIFGPPPRNVLLVNFRTSEVNFLQVLRSNPELQRRWDRVKSKKLRWYSPGETITGDQIVSEIWRYISQSRREGNPVERVGFDETEVAEDFLLGLKQAPLFWQTLLELTSTEAATSFYVCGTEDEQSDLVKVLRAGADYVFHVVGESQPRRRVEVKKSPMLQSEDL